MFIQKKPHFKKKAYHCPKCGNSKFRPATPGNIGPLYYFIGVCCECNTALQCCPECSSWDLRSYGEHVCCFCFSEYYMPTIEEERQQLEMGKPNFILQYRLRAID